MIFLHRFSIIFLLFLSPLFATSTHDTQRIKEAIMDKYRELYPSLHIKKLTIRALGRTPKNFSNYTIEKIYISEATLKRNRGTFSVLYHSPKKKRKRFFKFTLGATIGVYVTNYRLKREQPINENYVHYEERLFKNFSSMPIDSSYFDSYACKRDIKENSLLLKRDLKRILDIKRGKLIDATLHDENVELRFKVKAVDEGNIGEMIRVKRGLYKKFNARITSKNSVEIIE